MPQKDIHFFLRHHTMETYWGSGSIAPHILNLGTRWRWVVSSIPRLLYSQGKRSQYQMDRRLHWAHSCCGHSDKEKIPVPARNQTL